jgi:hypothetical protein
VTRELLERLTDVRQGALATAQHFAEYRPFYRAMLTGSCAYAMTRTLNSVFAPFNRGVLERFTDLDPATEADLLLFLTGGAGAVINDWVVDGADPLDPDELATRLHRLRTVLL